MRRYYNLPFLKKTALYLTFILLGLIPLFWFKDGLLIAGGDNTFSYLGFARKFNSPVTWDSYVNFGFPTRGLHNLIYSSLTTFLDFIPDPAFQRLFFSSLFFLRALIYYRLLCLVFRKERNKTLFFPAVLLFALNPYFLPDSISLNGFLVPIQMSLIFIFVHKFLNRGRFDFRYLIPISIVNPLLFSNVAALLVTYIPGSLYFVFNFFFHQKKRVSIPLKKVLEISLVLIGLNLWYLVPMVKSLLEVYDRVSVAGSAFRATESGYLYDHFRLIGQWGWYTGHYLYDAYFLFAENYYKFPLIFFTFGVTLAALSFLLFLPLREVFKKNEIETFYFFILLFLFGLALANGGKLPLGGAYTAIYNAHPIFQMFREPWAKFTPLMVFSLPVLLYGSLLYLRQKIKNNHLQKVLYGILIVVIIINVYPVFTGEVIWDKWNGSMRSFRVEIPEYWQDARGYIVTNNLQEFRLLTFPASRYGMAYNWHHGLSSADDVASLLLPNSIVRYSSFPLYNSDQVVNQLFVKLSDKEFNLKNYLSLLNVRYVLQENDVDWRYSDKSLSPSESNKILVDNDFEIVKPFGFFDKEYLSQIPNDEPNKRLYDGLYQELVGKPALILYKLDDKYFLPHFYVPQNIVYADVGIEGLVDALGFRDYEVRSGIYLGSSKIKTQNSNVGDGRILERVDDIFVVGEREEVFAQIRDSEWKEGWVWPEADVKPGSWTYPLVRLKEWWAEQRAKEPFGKADVLFWHGLKRVAEIKKFAPQVEATKLGNLYRNKVEQAVAILKSVSEKEQDREFWGMVKKILAYSRRVEDGVEKTGTKEDISKLHAELRVWVGGLLSSVCESKYCYEVRIPDGGEYSVFVGEEDLEMLGTGVLHIEKEELEPALEQGEKNWLSFGKVHLEKGKHRLALRIPKSVDLVDEGNLEGRLSFYDRLVEWGPDRKYQVSFDYRLEDEDTMLVAKIVERGGEDSDRRLLDIGSVRGIGEGAGEWKHFATTIKSSSDAQESWVYIYTAAAGDFGDVGFKNVEVRRMPEPKVVLRRVRELTNNELVGNGGQVPKITFVKVNPTKYRVKVEGASEPYTLIFSENFHKGWRIYEVQNSKFNLEGEQVPYEAGVQDDYGGITADYFDGEIKEGTHRNTFIELGTLETWGKKSINADHLMVNGYANSWYIEPEDVGYAENYELIVEFWPQRLLYIGMFVSLLTLFGCIGYLSFGFIREGFNGRKS